MSAAGQHFDKLIAAVIVIVTAAFSTMIVVAMTLAMFLPVLRRVLIVVPTILHKVDRPSARVVLAAVFAPVLFMSGMNTKINRRRRRGDLVDDDRCREN